MFGVFPLVYTFGDAFAAKLDSGGHLVYSTYIGGPNNDLATAIRVDGLGNAYIGGPCSLQLPITPGVLKSTPCVAKDLVAWSPPSGLGYLAKVDSIGRIVYLTYLPDFASHFTVDTDGNVYFGGANAAGQVSVAKLNQSGSALVYSRPYDANGAKGVESLEVDRSGNLWFDGPSRTDRSYAYYLAELSSDGTKILYETPFIGGEIAFDEAGNLDV